MAHQTSTLLRITLALISAGFPLLAIVVGGRELLTWIRTNLGALYYVGHGYLGNSVVWRLIGISGVLPAGRALFNPDAQLRSLWLPPIVSLAMMVYPQSAGPPPHERARDHVYIQLAQLTVKLKHAANQRHPGTASPG
jgi:hypothetical protein